MDVTLNTVVFAADTAVLDLSLHRLARHTPRDARLAMWVNGSSKAVADYCESFAARRGRTRVYVSENIGHGDALDELMSRCGSRYFVCFDMDSFPVADGWLDDLKSKLDAGASCAGVLESAVGRRNKWGEYVHPSCLMIETEEFRRLRHPKHGLRFGGLSPRRADVGEMITVQTMRAGGHYDGWRYTHSHYPHLKWGFRYYGGYWCHIWQISRLLNSGCWKGVNVDDPDRDPDIDRVVRQGRDEIYRNYGVTADEFGRLLPSFIDEMRQNG